MLLDFLPGIHRDAIVSGRFHEVQLVVVRLELEQHGHVVEFGPKSLPLNSARHHIRLEQQKVSGVRHLEELPLADGVELPQLCAVLAGELALEAL